MEQEKLNEIIASHGLWLQDKGGKRANLEGANLRGANLCMADLERANLRMADLRGACLERAYLEGADIERAYLEGADLRGACLERTDLRGANLCKANLEGANLRMAYLEGAYLEGANLCMADLERAELPIGVYQIVGPGCCNRCTTYDSVSDQVICGCWDDKKGNHLDSFIARIESIYGSNGKKPNSVYYAEYMSAVDFFRAMKDLNKKS